MDKEDIMKLRDLGEVTKVQFKERINDKYDAGCELVAFSNTHGGTLVVGINDKTGELNPLSYQEAQETTNLLGNMASDNVIPGILLAIESVEVEGGCLVVAQVKEGLNKPYHDNKGIVWVKNGADKRKVFDNAEYIGGICAEGCAGYTRKQLDQLEILLQMKRLFMMRLSRIWMKSPLKSSC